MGIGLRGINNTKSMVFERLYYIIRTELQPNNAYTKVHILRSAA